MRQSFPVSDGLAEELFSLGKGEDHDGYRLIESPPIADKSRWQTFKTIIVMRLEDQTYWSITRGFGSTESQDNEEGPFDAIPVIPVAAVVVTYQTEKELSENAS